MRTVTFADENLVREISKSFVPLWHNQDPEGEAGGKCAAASQPAPAEANEYPMGGGGANLRTYICAPDGKVVFFLEGYWSAELYLGELRAALDLFEKAKKADGGTLYSKVAGGINTLSDEIQRQAVRMKAQFPEEFERPIQESKIRREHAALNLKLKSYAAAMKMVGSDVAAALTEAIRHNIERGATT